MLKEEILKKVEKPARYIGNEINVIEKNPSDADIRFAFAFPDVYEVGMSHLGMEIMYYCLNQREDTFCERVYTPWIDMEKLLREENMPLFALESQDELMNFDFLGFTLQYEMCYTNILTMLDLANIPFLSVDRNEDCPIIIAGGPTAYNPEPLADIVDVFYIGEGEIVIHDILDIYKEIKNTGGTKEDFFNAIISIDGIYIPKYYDTSYNIDGTISSFKPNNPNAKEKIKKVFVEDLNNAFYPKKQLVPLIEVVHDRVSMEVFRGCIRGCRFCQAGYTYRPVREKSSNTIVNSCNELINNTGHEEISLVSLSTGDYTEFPETANSLLELFKDSKVNLSLPSLRVDGFSIGIMEKIQEVRKSSITFAPEAGSQKMRDVINKGITEEEILTGCSLCFHGGWNRIKLYFMVGLPYETMEDVIDISKLSNKIVAKYMELPKENRSRPLSLNVSTSCFVPKPFTPFQWEKQNTYDEFMEKQYKLKDYMKSIKPVRYTYHQAKLSVLEGVFSRGNRHLSKVLIRAYEKGARFDGWSEHFNYNLWVEAFNECNIDMDFYVRQYDEDEILPWDFIDIGITKEFLLREKENAKNASITPNCRDKCSYCGVQKFKGGICVEKCL